MPLTISYVPFENIISSLRDDGLVVQANLLHHYLHEVAWTSGSELIGELGVKLNEIKCENFSALSNETKSNLAEGMKMVKIVWPDFPEE